MKDASLILHYLDPVSDFNIKDLDDIDVPTFIHNKSVVEVSEQLSSINEANKIYTYSKIYKNFTCQTYLSLVFLKQSPKNFQS